MELIISVIAILISFFSLFYTFRENRRLFKFNKAIFSLERWSKYEGMLGEIPEALKFYNIDLDELKEEGISPKEVAFLVMALNAAVTAARIANIKTSELIGNSDYWQIIMKSPQTKKVWRHAQKCFDPSMSVIENFMTE